MKTLKIQKWSGESILECAEKIAHKPYTLFFDSNRPTHPSSQWSFLCYDPIEIIETKNGTITHNKCIIKETNFFEFLQSRLDKYSLNNESNIPFIGGAAGYFGYDLGRKIENLPNNTEDILNAPDAAIGIYNNVIAHDHKKNETWLIGDAPEFQEVKKTDDIKNKDIQFTSNKTDADYCNDIQKIIDYIYAGEIYQANLSRLFMADLPKNFNSFGHYKKLRKINSAPYAGFMNFGDMQLLSCSPEQFLSLKKNIITTCPIKGTLPSNQNPQELLTSEKDRAENIMIVDLLRNDISKVSKPNSVKVDSLCALETFEGLHHLVSTVTGELQDSKSATDLLQSCFPGGSITGAPKIRAQEIIEEIEDTRRGPYCGAMGYIGFDGTMDSNIIIRTVIVKDDTAYLNLGSGIISDSVPQKELQETNDKGIKIFESFKT